MWALAGCSLVVAGDPSIVCKNDDGCPADQRCAKGPATCIAAKDACTASSCGVSEHCDASTLRCIVDDPLLPDSSDEPDADGPDAPDVRRPDADSTPPVVKIGASCASQSECSNVQIGSARVPGICASEPLSGFDTPSFCTTHCCETSDCPANFFCEHGPNAGRYCVPFRPTTRPQPTGAKLGGATCTTSAECITGNCDAADTLKPAVKTCLDTCCKDSDCETGLVCGLRNGTTLQWVCRTPMPGGGGPNTDCSEDGVTACRSGACYGDLDAFCTTACCSNASCTTLGFARCVSGSTETNTSRVNICADDNGGATPGSPCSNDSNCLSGICIEQVCAYTCCTDSDCPAGRQRCAADGNEPRPHCAAAD